MCFFQEEGPLLIRDLVCKSEFLFGCFLEVLKNYKLSNRFQLVTPDLWCINTAAPWLLRWDDSLCACITQSSRLCPQESAPIPHYDNSLDITFFLTAIISLSHFPFSLSVLDLPNNLLVLESWPWGSASGSTHPKTNPQRGTRFFGNPQS